MSYQTEIIRKESLTTSRWSGGTTTQLYISPSTAIYAERKFNWRISSAVVEIEESDFTPLPGYQRIIMILEGDLDLKHLNQHEVQLKVYQQDTFCGDWQTKSIGLVTDFNLILNKECQGSLQAIVLPAGAGEIINTGNTFPVKCGLEQLTDAFYVADGNAEIVLEGSQIYQLSKGDLMLIRRTADAEIVSIQLRNIGDGQSAIVLAKVLDICAHLRESAAN